MRKNYFIILSVIVFLCNYRHVNAQIPTTFGVGTDPVGTLHIHSSIPIQDDAGVTLMSGDSYIGNYKTIFHMTNAATTKTSIHGFSIIQENDLVTLRQFESAKLRIHGYNQTGITIATNGYVGIGTDNPSQKLHVYGNAVIQGSLNLATTFCMGVDNQTFTIGKAHYEGLHHGSTYLGFNAMRSAGTDGIWVCKNNTWQNGGAVIWATMEGDLLFANIQSVGSTDQIGLTDDDIMSYVNMKLGADGLLMAKEVKVTLTDWPDYVFDDNYTLPSLEKTEEYIKDNGHLPGVPSAAEIEEDGLDLGQMNKILMQKVEELTLQVIELNKQIKELKRE